MPSTPNAYKGESPAFDIISIECIGDNGGIESPFVNNTKMLVKYNLTQEVI